MVVLNPIFLKKQLKLQIKLRLLLDLVGSANRIAELGSSLQSKTSVLYRPPEIAIISKLCFRLGGMGGGGRGLDTNWF